MSKINQIKIPFFLKLRSRQQFWSFLNDSFTLRSFGLNWPKQKVEMFEDEEMVKFFGGGYD